jgi:hypothetical protein
MSSPTVGSVLSILSHRVEHFYQLGRVLAALGCVEFTSRMSSSVV